MNWSHILKYMCGDIDSNNRNSFPKNNCDNNDTNCPSPIQTVAWNKLCEPKCKGGLNIRKILMLLL